MCRVKWASTEIREPVARAEGAPEFLVKPWSMGFTPCKMWRHCRGEKARSCSKNGRSCSKTKDPAQKQTILLKSEIPRKFCFVNNICLTQWILSNCFTYIYNYGKDSHKMSSCTFRTMAVSDSRKIFHHVHFELWQWAIAAKSFIMYI